MNLNELDNDKIKESFFIYAKIFALSFVVPLSIILLINEGTVIWKIIN